MKTHLVLAVIGVALALPGLSSAQTFPPASAWQPLPCGIAPMTDPLRDQSGAVGERDLVGDRDFSAGLFAWDPGYLFMRLRVDGDPMSAGKLKPFVWGFELSLDTDPTTYELLIAVNGLSGAVEVSRNTTTTQANDPSDPADQPPAITHPVATHARIEAAPGSSFAGDPDFFVSLAVSWSELAPLGLRPTSVALVLGGTSSTASALNSDIACHDGRTGTPVLDRVGGVATVFDVTVDTDADKYPDWYEVRYGSDPTVAGSHPAGDPPGPNVTPGSFGSRIEGGGGCAVGGAAGSLAMALLLVGALFALRRRR